MTHINETENLKHSACGRGGKREGSGRKKGEPTVTLSYRVKEDKAEEIDKLIRENILKIIK